MITGLWGDFAVTTRRCKVPKRMKVGHVFYEIDMDIDDYEYNYEDKSGKVFYQIDIAEWHVRYIKKKRRTKAEKKIYGDDVPLIVCVVKKDKETWIMHNPGTKKRKMGWAKNIPNHKKKYFNLDDVEIPEGLFTTVGMAFQHAMKQLKMKIDKQLPYKLNHPEEQMEIDQIYWKECIKQHKKLRSMVKARQTKYNNS